MNRGAKNVNEIAPSANIVYQKEKVIYRIVYDRIIMTKSEYIVKTAQLSSNKFLVQLDAHRSGNQA